MARLGIGLVALLALTAFAPAPFPNQRREKRQQGITLARFQGTWEVVSYRWLNHNKATELLPRLKAIRIKDDVWTPVSEKGVDLTSCRIGIDSRQKPAALDFFEGKAGTKLPLVGVIRQKGDRIEILYLDGAHSRPTSFDKPVECARIALRRSSSEARK